MGLGILSLGGGGRAEGESGILATVGFQRGQSAVELVVADVLHGALDPRAEERGFLGRVRFRVGFMDWGV